MTFCPGSAQFLTSPIRDPVECVNWL